MIARASSEFYDGSVMPHYFSTPTRRVFPGGDRFWRRLGDTVSLSVLKEGAFYRTVEEPTNEEVAAADVVYLGGRVHTVSDAEADSLTVAGYGAFLHPVPARSGFGHGRYGKGAYGTGDTQPSPPGAYGAGAYGGGNYSE